MGANHFLCELCNNDYKGEEEYTEHLRLAFLPGYRILGNFQMTQSMHKQVACQLNANLCV